MTFYVVIWVLLCNWEKNVFKKRLILIDTKVWKSTFWLNWASLRLLGPTETKNQKNFFFKIWLGSDFNDVQIFVLYILDLNLLCDIPFRLAIRTLRRTDNLAKVTLVTVNLIWIFIHKLGVWLAHFKRFLFYLNCLIGTIILDFSPKFCLKNEIFEFVLILKTI